MRGKFKIILATVAGLLLSGTAAVAEVEVAEGEYVLRMNNIAAANGRAKKNLLVNVTAAASTNKSQRKVVKYNKKQIAKDCAQLAQRFKYTLCEPNAKLYAFDLSNDPLYSLVRDAFTQANVQSAWDVTKGSNNVIVAVTDSGIDYSHLDLKANMWSNPNEIANDGVDNDGNGIVDDVHGANFVDGNGNPYDDNGHGTHVAGTIGAVGNNSRGIVGVNWNVSLMGVKFLDAEGGGYLADAVDAIEYIISQKEAGQNIVAINASWGGGGYLKILEQAIADAGKAGILFIAAAGNEGNNNDRKASYPANYDLANIISVGAVDSDDTLAYFSNFGVTTVDIAAPGVNILSTTPGNKYEYLSGTSMATPHVAGAVALLAAANPSLSSTQIKSLILSSARPASIKAANGILDVATAISLAPSNPVEVSVTLDRKQYATPSNFMASISNLGASDALVSLSLDMRGFVNGCELSELTIAAGSSVNISGKFAKLSKASLATLTLSDSNGLILDQVRARLAKTNAKKAAPKVRSNVLCQRIKNALVIQ